MATLRIHRFVEGRKWVQDYTVEVTKGMTVLEALISIKEHQDPTLSFTCSCRSSICGACAVRVNGNAELSCEKLVADLIARYQTETLTIEPLGNFRVIRDLIVDWDPKYARIKKVKPVVHPKDESSAEDGCRRQQRRTDGQRPAPQNKKARLRRLPFPALFPQGKLQKHPHILPILFW